MSKKKLLEQVNQLIKEEVEKIKYGKVLSEGLRFHIENKISFSNNIYRPYTSKYYELIREMRVLWKKGKIKLNEADTDLAKSNAGEFGVFEGKKVPLDIPFLAEEDTSLDEAEYQGKDVELGKPKRGGSKKFYVYTKCGGKVKKISFGSPSMSIKISDPERRKSFIARHKCKQKNDRCTAGYWACRIGRYPHLTGAKKSYTWW